MAEAKTATRSKAAAGSLGTPKVTTFLTFKERGEEAVKFYVSLFRNSRVLSIARWQGDQPVSRGALMHAAFELDGQRFMAMNGGPQFLFAGYLAVRELRDAGGDRRAVAQALRRRRGAAVRLAQGQVRRVVADHPDSIWAI